MNARAVDREDPDRWYIVTRGRSRADEDAFDLVTLIVSESEPTPEMQSEHVKILQMCRNPAAVVEISSRLGLPVSVVKILLRDLLDVGHITARHTYAARGGVQSLDRETLEQVLVGLQSL
jgi:predicted transcriptional regulator